MPSADFRVEYHGTITLLFPLTDACREWITENVHIEDWQWFGRALAVEPRSVNQLIDALTEEGFTGSL